MLVMALAVSLGLNFLRLSHALISLEHFFSPKGTRVEFFLETAKGNLLSGKKTEDNDLQGWFFHSY